LGSLGSISLHAVGNGCPGWEGEIKMYATRNPANRTVLVAILVAIGGGLLIALVAKVIPRMMSKMMSRMMSGMMQNMRAKMKEDGITPAEMCEKMMQGDGADQPAQA
jgi:hypothetical protein